MKTFNITLGLMLLLAGVASDSALADRKPAARSSHPAHAGGTARHAHPGHRPRTRVFIAAPVFAPWYYPPFGHFTTGPLTEEPQLYVEQDPAAPETGQQHYYWYYCPDAQAYYPYVDACPGGWQAVEPELPAPS